MCVCVCVCWLQILDLKPQIDQANKTGSPIVVTLNATVYNNTYPLVIDLSRSDFKNNSVTITGKGPDKTILDCYGYGGGVVVQGAGSVSFSNLTIQNCDTNKIFPSSSYGPDRPSRFSKHVNLPSSYSLRSQRPSKVDSLSCCAHNAFQLALHNAFLLVDAMGLVMLRPCVLRRRYEWCGCVPGHEST